MNCLQCGKKLGRKIHAIYVPMEVNDYVSYIEEEYPGLVIVDTDVAVAKKKNEIRSRFAQQNAQAERAQMELMDYAEGSNNPPARTPFGNHRKTALESLAEPPDASMYKYQVRVWREGEYGPDGLGLFHSGTCAQRWGIYVASEMKRKGLL